MKTHPMRPKYDFTPHIRITRASDRTSMSRDNHLDVVEREFTDWLKRHKWKKQAKQFEQVCENVRREHPDYDSRINHIEYFVNMTIEGLKSNVSRRLDAA